MLATIEMKGALLQEKLYVEKMEALAWEEALVANGTHNTFIVCAHFVEGFIDFHPTIGIRPKPKHLQLASQCRTYKVNDATKWKCAAKNAVDSWWKLLLSAKCQIVALTSLVV
jgi:hypothetical protein